MTACAFITTHASEIRAEDVCLTFRADEVVLDPEEENVELRGAVEARCGPYALYGERIMVRKAGGRTRVQGPASLSLCPCEQVPVALDFDRAELCEDGDLTLRQPTLRLGAAPVLWLPWLWLRAPHRTGALPPRVAWRGDGGLLLGPGIRLPWTSEQGALSWMDLYVSGYTRGGVEVASSIVTASSQTTVTFDRMHGDLFRLKTHGVVERRAHGGLAWHSDLSRGSRGRSGLVHLRDAARVFDHGSAFFDLRPWPSGFIRSGVVAAGRRGSDTLAFGPSLFADGGGGLGGGAAWEAGAGLRMLGGDEGATQLASSYARLVVGRWWGPLRMAVDGQSTAHSQSASGQSLSDLAAWGTSEIGVPLARRLGASTHWVEPFARGMVLGARRSAGGAYAIRPKVLEAGGRWLTLVGVKSAIGPGGGARGGRVELAFGGIGDWTGGPVSRAVVSRLTMREGLFGLDGEAAGVERAGERSAVVIARARVGATDTLGMTGEVASRSELDTLDARVLSPAGATWTPVAPMSSAGTSAFIGGHVPLGKGFLLEANSDWDVGAKRWLAVGSGVVLEHPCGCARGRVWISRRVGRPGTDAWLSMELR